ncbi:acyl-CoA dehydrogenase family protein [Streptomyces sp. NA02950]|uniref:acyl-CoA dehydrogenase family protein n=1 Tax=Streptomyces sp. NA02950 TaxID=2742137 RepID=UPI0015913FA1|nr:acyl-CoA dehydrogenase family protein [Streptomyces sp. NA02950]QKV91476.1 acyl-CoA dehydrogenase family protein [Streptomyces sp. NA02950]
MRHWSEEQRSLRAAVEKVGAAIGADHLERDGAGEFTWDGWARLRDMGLFGLPFATEWGGLGQDLPTTMYVLEGLGHSCRDAGLTFSVSTHIVSTGVPLQRFGSTALKQRYLPGICSGTLIGAHAITEPDGGSDVMGMRTTAVADGEDFLLSGSKAFVSNGPIADLLVVYARTGTAGALDALTAFLVPTDTPGLTVGNPVGKMGLRTSPLSEVFLDGVRVARSQVLGSVGSGFLILDEVMKWEILCGFSGTLGEMCHRLERCVDHARTRTQFGVHIGANQAVSHRIVDMKMDVETSRKWLYDTAEKFTARESVVSDLAIAKLVVSEANVRSALAAVQIFGGAGYTTEYGIEKELRNAVSGTIYSGTSEMQRQRLAVFLGLDRASAARGGQEKRTA